MTLNPAFPAITADEARRLTDRIKVAVEGTWQLVLEAYQSRAWSALGYSSWDDYCTREFGTSRLRLPREERQEIVASLRESGLSIRAISAATGYGTQAIQSDLRSGVVIHHTSKSPTEPEPQEAARSVVAAAFAQRDEPAEPAKVTGIDGKSYPKPAVVKDPPAPRSPNRRALPDQARDAGQELRKAIERLERLAADDRFSRNKNEVAAHLRHHLDHALKVCQDLSNSLND